MPFICELGCLKELSIAKNDISDEGVQFLAKMKNQLIYLDIMNNKITSASLFILAQCSGLTHLYVGWNQITGTEGIQVLMNIESLVCLDARMNPLSNVEK